MEKLTIDKFEFILKENKASVTLPKNIFDSTYTIESPVTAFIQYNAITGSYKGSPLVLKCDQNIVATIDYNDNSGLQQKFIDLTPFIPHGKDTVLTVGVIVFGSFFASTAKVTFLSKGVPFLDRSYGTPNQSYQTYIESWTVHLK